MLACLFTSLCLIWAHYNNSELVRWLVIRAKKSPQELNVKGNGTISGYRAQHCIGVTNEMVHRRNHHDGAVRDAIESLRASGVNSFVLDLRDNSGGLFAEGIETAKIWLEKGVIVYICDSGGVRDIFETDGSNAIAASEPLIVLVNRGTASASEILAGALKDNRRAVLYGEPTFGKGKIQSVFELSDGSGLAVTVARYETPGHTDIDKVGIIPDHTLPPSFPLDEDSFCRCLKDPASTCNLNTAGLFSR